MDIREASQPAANTWTMRFAKQLRPKHALLSQYWLPITNHWLTPTHFLHFPRFPSGNRRKFPNCHCSNTLRRATRRNFPPKNQKREAPVPDSRSLTPDSSPLLAAQFHHSPEPRRRILCAFHITQQELRRPVVDVLHPLQETL